jgi:endonuclease YncB( thermonuclease family)
MVERVLLPAVGVALLLTNGPAQAQRSNDLVNRRVTAQVVAVIDGDTVDVLIPPARRVRVRLHGVDTPETGEPFYQQARVFTRVLMFSRTVEVTGKEADVYGRLVARITVDGNDASEAIIAAGLGCTFRRYVSDPVLNTALSRARAARQGFWAAESHPACAAREAQAVSAPSTAGTPAATNVIGNTSSKVYHLPTCPNAGCKSCTRTFASHAEADAAGFRPAGDCLGRERERR